MDPVVVDWFSVPSISSMVLLSTVSRLIAVADEGVAEVVPSEDALISAMSIAAIFNASLRVSTYSLCTGKHAKSHVWEVPYAHSYYVVMPECGKINGVSTDR